MFKRRFVLPAIVAGALLGSAALAAPAMADPCPNGSSCANATVHIAVGIQFAFGTATSFTLQPNVKSPAALTFSVSTNNPHGFSVQVSGTDPTTGNATFPANELNYDTFSGGADVSATLAPQALTNNPVVVTSSSQATNGTNFSQDWNSTIAANQSPGDYVSTLSFVASVNP